MKHLYLLPVNADHFPADAKDLFLRFRLTTKRATLTANKEIAPIIMITLALQLEWRMPNEQRGSTLGEEWQEIDSPSFTCPTVHKCEV